ncbi:hypothetical protein [Brytella acorum]|uniref:Uncharacterized protein n=1 Tax=Brytella acorum TaxID=2959299 RepID=A0AA35Y4Q5_9PROT|nr:hypothetical protein [Brytella acorum]MDF3625170.1 hypothetical protein [Brytella acorum]CAI9122072.1 hypothetical protein LMG32879_002929 [Brytella acorum]
MAQVYIEPRPKGRRDGEAIEVFVVEDHKDHVRATFRTQHEAIVWATKERHLNDKAMPGHWRAV